MSNKIIVICGPTASGKTSLGVELAKRINGEIISADSMQVYKEMNIGTAKVTLDEMQGIPHHLIDFVNPSEEYNVSMYRDDALKKIEEIFQRGKTPIIVGGTGLYIDTLINGIEFSEIETDEEYRKQLEKLINEDENGKEILFEELRKIDEESANKIDKNNIRRVIRALEIYKVTGKTKSQIDRESVKGTEYNFIVFGINLDREELYERINKRVDVMIVDGLIDEVKNVCSKYELSKTAIQALGYKEVIEYFNNEISYDEMVEKIKRESRRYAKRQMTWFRHINSIIWLEGNDKESMLDKIISKYERDE